MLIFALAGFSFLAGMVIPFVGSVALVIYFSAAAATIIAVLAYAFGSALGSIVLAWFITVFAVQLGFVASTVLAALAKSYNWQWPFNTAQRRPDYADATDNAPLQPSSVRVPTATPPNPPTAAG